MDIPTISDIKVDPSAASAAAVDTLPDDPPFDHDSTITIQDDAAETQRQ